MQCRYNVVNFLTNIHKRHPIPRPVRARYGVSFVDPASDCYCVPVSVVIYVLSYNIGPRYNGTALYNIPFIAICRIRYLLHNILKVLCDVFYDYFTIKLVTGYFTIWYKYDLSLRAWENTWVDISLVAPQNVNTKAIGESCCFLFALRIPTPKRNKKCLMKIFILYPSHT